MNVFFTIRFMLIHLSPRILYFLNKTQVIVIIFFRTQMLSFKGQLPLITWAKEINIYIYIYKTASSGHSQNYWWSHCISYRKCFL